MISQNKITITFDQVEKELYRLYSITNKARFVVNPIMEILKSDDSQDNVPNMFRLLFGTNALSLRQKVETACVNCLHHPINANVSNLNKYIAIQRVANRFDAEYIKYSNQFLSRDRLDSSCSYHENYVRKCMSPKVIKIHSDKNRNMKSHVNTVNNQIFLDIFGDSAVNKSKNIYRGVFA